MSTRRDGSAVIWCQGSFGTPNGKTAHGLVRHTERYRVRAVVDRRHAGADAGTALDDRPAGVPIVASLEEALDGPGADAEYFVVGLAPDGGRLTDVDRDAVRLALRRGLHVDCGLHDFLSEDPELVDLAASTGARIRDIRKPPPVRDLHHFSGRIDEVESQRIAVLGTDSAVGKRTTAVLLVEGLRRAGDTAVLIGTGQTAWMQGVRYGIVLDSLINDFVAGELEHAVLRAWDEERPEAMVIEGQGSLMNPAYPGGLEILAATRPHCIVLQHAPARLEYDGFPGFPLHPLVHQIRALELVGNRNVVAVAVNHEGLSPAAARDACEAIEAETGRVACAPLLDGVEPLVQALRSLRT